MSLVTIESITASLLVTRADGANTYEVYVLLSDFVKVRITVTAANEPAAIAIGRKVIQKLGYLDMESPVTNRTIQVVAKGSEGDVDSIFIESDD